MNETHPYTYLIVRTDISLAQQIVQAAHATHYAGFRFQEPKEVSSLILLQVSDEIELFQAYRKIAMSGIKVEPFFEPDNDMGLSAIATEPIYTQAQRKQFYSYELWSHEDDGPSLTSVAKLSTYK